LGDSYTIGESVDPEDRYPVQVMRLLAQRDHLAIGDPEIVAVTGWTTGNLLEALTAVNAERGNISAKPEEVGASATSRAVGASAKSGEVGASAKPEEVGASATSGAVGASAKSGAAYDIVSLLIGVNNQFQGRSQAEYREQFGRLLQTCIRLAGNRPDHVVVLSIPDYSVTPFGRAGDTALIATQIDSFNRINFGLAKDYKVNYVDVTAESRKAAVDSSLIAIDGLHFSGKEYEVWARLMEPVCKGMLQ
jgi:lysophospholipase L1-like esterase